MVGLLAKRSISLLAENTPQANNNSSNAGKERGVVGSLVAAQSIGAIPVPAWANHGMLVKDSAVEQIENIATEDRRKGHYPPVLREATDSKGVRHERWEYTEEEAICYPCKGRDGNKGVRVRDHGPSKLSQSKYNRRDEQAPETGHVELLN